jgi:DNA-binding transcriptional ArsR family regulator
LPQLHGPATADTSVQFVVAPGLDVLNAMYFTFLAGEYEGVGEWPVEARRRLDPALRDEMNLLFTFPRGEPGILGALTDTSFLHPETWGSVDDLLAYLRDLPADGAPQPERLGIRGLAAYALRWPCDEQVSPAPPPASVSRAQFARALQGAAGAPDRDTALALYDGAEQLRARMLRAVRRFYDEHYRPDEARRLECMRRSVEAHTGDSRADPQELMDRIAQRHINCIDIEAPGAYQRFVFTPSLDVGVYNSCADVPPVHGFFYRCEPQFVRALPAEDVDTERLAGIYRALADEQRLRILRLLQGRELYAQEIVERTGLHQSVVSRHLSFLKAVGLVTVRPQNTMKFYALNPVMGDQLREAVDRLIPARVEGRR